MKNTSYKIVLIGSGNVATQLGFALKKSKQNIVQVYSRNIKNAFSLAKLLKSDATNNVSKIISDADIYIIAIKDDEIASIAKKIKIENKIIVHTSGSVAIGVLKNMSKNYGVFYPLQTIAKNKKTNFSKIPICIEANNKSTFEILKQLASKISKHIYNIDSEQRKQIHLAAVFACNFTNQMYAIAEQILKQKKIPFTILYPLISETASKIKHNSPVLTQTGPAKRGDKKVMQEHLKLLSNKKDWAKLYSLISKQIAANKAQ